MDQLAALRAFTRIVDTGSFTRAAAATGLPKPTVSKLVQQLEAHLSTKLLSRTTRRVTVTADGAAYYERAVQLLADLDELDGSMTALQARPRGRLRIDVPSVLAHDVIVPGLGGFFEAYPEITLEIGVSDRPADLVAENVDCVIRAGAIQDQSLIARRIAELHMTTCAASSYVQARGLPDHPDAIADGHLVVAFMRRGSAAGFKLLFRRGDETREVTGRHQAAVDDARTYLGAALAGHGIVQLPSYMARDHFRQGTLVPVLPGWSVPALPLHAVYPPNRHLSTRVRVFVDWAAALFAAAGLSRPPD